MNGPRATGAALALALLLALSPVAALPTAGVPPAPSDPAPTLTDDTATPPVTTQNGTVGRLVFPGGEQETATVAAATLDVGASVAMDDAALRGRYERLRLVEAFENASTAAERRAVVSRAYERLDEHIATLERRERQALQRYNRGTTTAETYLRELAAVDAGADATSPAIVQLYQYARTVDDSPVDKATIAGLKARLVGLNGPVRERVKQAMRGDTTTERVYVSTSGTGVILAAVVGDEFDRRYVREAYLPDDRAAGAPDQFFRDGQYQLEEEAQSRASELYPWVFDNRLSFSVGSRTGEPYLYRAGVYSVTVDHPQGTSRSGDLITYLDGGTTEVFREVQYLAVDEIPTSAPRTNRSDGLLVQVNRTYAGGPLEVRVRDNETGEPVSATVRVDGERVGETGPDGRIWTLTPGDPFLVNATTDDASVDVRITFPSDQF